MTAEVIDAYVHHLASMNGSEQVISCIRDDMLVCCSSIFSDKVYVSGAIRYSQYQPEGSTGQIKVASIVAGE